MEPVAGFWPVFNKYRKCRGLRCDKLVNLKPPVNCHGRFCFVIMISLPMLPSLLPATINHLLAQEPWARDKLLSHAGKVACVDTGLFAIKLKVAPSGLLETGRLEEGAANVTIRIKPSDLPAILQNRERAFSYVTIEGDADFANTVSQLSQSLRWEAEHDLSKLVGDIAAARLVAGTRTVLGAAKATQQKLAENVAEYFLEERPMLVRPQMVEDFAGEVSRMRDDLERLAKRIEKLERAHS
jgi:ubiquinone biosynthesis accessory factor UbiJ